LFDGGQVDGLLRMAGVRRSKSLARTAFNSKSFRVPAEARNRIVDYHNRQIVFSEGEKASDILFLQSGRVKLAATSPQGKEAIVRLVAPGDFFGYQVLDGYRTRLATATAMTESSVLRIDGAVMFRLLREDPVFSAAFVGHLVQQLVSVEETLVDHLFNSSEKRLARVLLLLAHFDQKGQPGTLVVPSVTHEVLAQMVGTTRARVTYFMTKFRKMGFVDYQGGLRVHESLFNLVLRD